MLHFKAAVITAEGEKMSTNETIKTILERRSTRAYKNELPPIDQLEAILKAAEWAPSAMNNQECHITLVKDGSKIKALDNAIVEKFDAATKERMATRFPEGVAVSAFYYAPAIYVISAVNTEDHYTKVDTGITIQNIAIAAKSFGIDTCMIGLSAILFSSDPNHSSIKALDLPADHTPMIVIVAGYGDMEMPKPERKEGRTKII